jgi:hypothetical protein
MRTTERYPELAGFTERLLEGLDEVLVAERAKHGAGGPVRPARRMGSSGRLRRYALGTIGAAAAVTIGIAGLQPDGGDQAPAPQGAPSGALPSAAEHAPAAQATSAKPVLTLRDLALVAERQPAASRPTGPIEAVLRESIVSGEYDAEIDGESFVVRVDRRMKELYRRDGSVRIEQSAPTKLTFPSARDRALYERWRAWYTGQPASGGKLQGAFKLAPIAPDGGVHTEPADPERAKSFDQDHNSGKLIFFQATSGEMVGILPPAELPTDPAALRRAILRAIEPFAADSSAEEDLVGKVGTRRELLMSTVLALLTNDTVGPRQRAAAFRMLEGVEGVTVVPNASDHSGRKGFGVRWDDTRNGPSSPTLWVFDRKASRLLGTESSVTLVGGKRKHSTVVLRHENIR